MGVAAKEIRLFLPEFEVTKGEFVLGEEEKICHFQNNCSMDNKQSNKPIALIVPCSFPQCVAVQG